MNRGAKGRICRIRKKVNRFTILKLISDRDGSVNMVGPRPIALGRLNSDRRKWREREVCAFLGGRPARSASCQCARETGFASTFLPAYVGKYRLIPTANSSSNSKEKPHATGLDPVPCTPRKRGCSSWDAHVGGFTPKHKDVKLAIIQ